MAATPVPQPEAPSTPDQTAAAGHKTVETPKPIAEALAKPENQPKPGVTDEVSVPHENSHINIDWVFPPRDRFPIQIFSEETWLQKFGHWGPIVTGVVMGVASIILTAFVWQSTKELTDKQIELDAQQVTLQKRQVELQGQQTKLQNDQIEAELADLRFKFLNDLTATDENKKTPAEISLAAHGLKAFPVLHSALGVEQGNIRRSAVNVVYRLFQAEDDGGRNLLLQKLMEEFRFPNKTLHTGVVQSFVKIEPLLSPEQRAIIITFLQQKVVPQTACGDQEGREVVLAASMFLGSKRPDANPYLLSVVNVPACGDTWLQAIYNLQESAPDMSAQEKADLRQQVIQVKREVLDHLDQKVTEKDLADGSGFTSFAKKGEFGITFGAFKKRIEKEFNRLLSQLR